MTEKQKQFILDNHTKYTCRELGRLLKIPHLKYYTDKLGIKFSRHYNNSNINQFKQVIDPTIAYFLGFLWADASLISRTKNNKKYYNGINLELVKEDSLELESFIKGKFIYNLSERKRINRRPQRTISISDSKLAEYLISHGFERKSFAFSESLLQTIDNKVIHYFWRGYLDGDGYIGKSSIQFSGNIDYEWSILINLLTELKIEKFSYRKYINQKTQHKFSAIIIPNKTHRKIFLEYVYQNYQNDKIGLKRKYKAYYNQFVGL